MATLHEYTIWQPRHPREQGFLAWADRCRLLSTDTVDLGLYHKVYSDTIPGDQPITILENLFAQFNLQRPPAFHGHSLSVGDVVVLDEQAYYCDIVGWQPVVVSSANSLDPL